MILVDTSAWVEYLRSTTNVTRRAVRELIEKDEQAVTTDIVIMEVLAGAKDEAHYQKLRRLMKRCTYEPLGGLDTYEYASKMYAACRRGGEAVRALTDCLIGAVAIRLDVEILHNDRDFDVLGRHSEVRAIRGEKP